MILGLDLDGVFGGGEGISIWRPDDFWQPC